MTEKSDATQIEEAIVQLGSNKVEDRQEAAWKLHDFTNRGIKGTDKAIPKLLEAIKDDDWAVRKLSIMALGKLHIKKAIPDFINYLNTDPSPEVRVGAVEALTEMKITEAIPHLIKVLDQTTSAILQQEIVWSLGIFGALAFEAVPKLIEFLLKPEDVNFIQINNLAAWALGKIGDKSAIEPLIKALYDAAYEERKFVIAFALALLEGPDGIGFSELQKMKENYELESFQIEQIDTLFKKEKKRK